MQAEDRSASCSNRVKQKDYTVIGSICIIREKQHIYSFIVTEVYKRNKYLEKVNLLLYTGIPWARSKHEKDKKPHVSQNTNSETM